MNSPTQNDLSKRKRPQAVELAALLLIASVGAALRFYRLGAQSIWFDEASSIATSRGSFGQILQAAAGQEGSPPLYFLLLRLMTTLGDGEFMVRLLSVLAGVAAILLVYLFARRLLGPVVGLLAAALLTLSPYALYYSQEARPYALLMALSIASCYALVSAVSRPALKRWIIYGLLSAAALYTHYFTVFLIIAQGVVLLAARDYRAKALRPWLVCVAAVAIAFLPWVPYLLYQYSWQTAKGGQIWVPHVGLLLIPYTFFQFSLGYSLLEIKQLSDLVSHAGVLIIGVIAFGIPFVAALLVARRRPEAARWILLLPAAAIGAALLFNLKFRAYQPTYLAGVMPLYIVALAYGVTQLARRPALLLAPALVVVLSVISIHNYYYDSQFAREDWRTVAAYLEGRAQPQDIIAFHKSYPRLAFDYYYDGAVKEYILPDSKLPPEDYRLQEAREAFSAHRAVWLVISHNFDTGPYYRNLLGEWFSAGDCETFTTCRSIVVCRFETQAAVAALHGGSHE